MSKARKNGNREVFQKLTTEPTSQIVVVADYENPACVIDGLIRAIVRLAIKYTEGVYYIRKRGGRDDLERLQVHRPVAECSLNPSCEINGELFVNALLVELFNKQEMGNLLLDKNKRPYAAQAIGKMYLRMFALRNITKDRVTNLKRLMHQLNKEWILLDDSYFAQLMNTSIIPNYLDRCKNAGLPCYKEEGLKQTYTNKSTSPLLKFLVLTVQHILVPNGPGMHYKKALEHIKNLVHLLKESVTKKTGGNVEDIPKARVVPQEPEREEADPLATLTAISGSEPRVSWTGTALERSSQDDMAIGVCLPPAPVQVEITVDDTCIGKASYVRMTGETTDTLPPGKNMIDRVMRYLNTNEQYFSLDDINEIRKWAVKLIDEELGKKMSQLNAELETLTKTYYA